MAMFGLPDFLMQPPQGQQQPQTGPVESPLEGLARALQMGINGYTASQQRANVLQAMMQRWQPSGLQAGLPSVPSDTGTPP
jgi:hypothetical protein